MSMAARRSRGVTDTLTVALSSRETSWDRFEALYRVARDDLYAYVSTLLRDPMTAEDVTALAFERAYRRRRLFDPRRGSERAWLFGIARNAALDELRKRKRTATLAAEPEDVDSSPAEDGEDSIVRRTTVRAALDDLSPREREIVALKFHAGLTNQELAKVLGVSESNAGTMLHRTMDKLRRACHATS
jgi:RNA polymerase sigma-70 factor (ECF subfamily)